MFCSKCGYSYSKGSKFCPACGAKLSSQLIEQPRSPQPVLPTITSYPQPTLVQAAPSQKNNVKKRAGCFLGCFGTIVIGILLFIAFILLLGFLFYGEETDPSQTNEPSPPYYEPIETTPSYTLSGQGIFGQSLNLTDVRNQYTNIYDDGTDQCTLMIYMIGSDLESDGGCATDDINEMLRASITTNLNVILMTGGATYWWNDSIQSDTCQYWQIKDGMLLPLETDLGLLNMTKKSTLSNFITYASSHFPANRYSLIMWDHGGGTFSGFGYDEYYPYDSLTLESIGDALDDSDVLFDFIGFDACLMGTMEIAFMLQPYADYFIASPESEPGNGWYYTDFLTLLNGDCSISTLELGIQIIDDYITKSCTYETRPQATLSLIELRQVPYMYSAFCNYFAEAKNLVETQNYATISIARSEAKNYGEREYEQIDAVDFIQKTSIAGSNEVLNAIYNAVVYYYNSPDMRNSYGLAFYFPYDYPAYYTQMQNLMKEIGFDDSYMAFFDQFISVMTSMQANHTDRTGQGAVDYSSESWYDTEIADTYDGLQTTIYDELEIVESGDNYVLKLSDAEWDAITNIELQVFLDDGDGYISLGVDNVYEFDDNGDLIIAFDYTWVTLDGNTVPYYVEFEETNRDDDWFTYGTVPALLNNDELIEIMVYWDNENPYGYVAGYRFFSEEATPLAKGLFDLQEDDTLDFLFDCYTYEYEYDDSYIIGDTYTITGNEIEVSYDYVEDLDSTIFFQLTDIYNNTYYTESVVYSD